MSGRTSTGPRHLRLMTDGPQTTQALASTFARSLRHGDLVVLTGDLGAGKTCFAQGIAIGLGIEERVTSPTFTLASRYQGRLVLNHLDVYRIDSESDAIDLAVEELLEDGVTVVEWGERIEGLLPDDRFVISLRYPDIVAGKPDPDPDGRTIEIEGPILERGLAQELETWSA